PAPGGRGARRSAARGRRRAARRAPRRARRLPATASRRAHRGGLSAWRVVGARSVRTSGSYGNRNAGSVTGCAARAAGSDDAAMHIAWTAFTPGAALAGGLLIGLAVAAFVLLVGRIAGISVIVGGLLRPARG